MSREPIVGLTLGHLYKATQYCLEISLGTTLLTRVLFLVFICADSRFGGSPFEFRLQLDLCGTRIADISKLSLESPQRPCLEAEVQFAVPLHESTL